MSPGLGSRVVLAVIILGLAPSLWAAPSQPGPDLLPTGVILVIVAIIAFLAGRRTAAKKPQQDEQTRRTLWVGQAGEISGLEPLIQVTDLVEAASYRHNPPVELIALEPAQLRLSLAELERQRDYLILREKSEAMNLLCAGIAHEVANPIGFVTVGTENLQADLEKFKDFLDHMLTDDDAEVLEAFTSRLDPLQGHLDIILGGCTRIRDITRELQAFARATPGKSRKLIVAHLIENIFGIARTRFKRQAQFILDGETGVKIVGNPAELNQVFLNLVLNAVQAIIRRQEESNDRSPGEVRITLGISDTMLRIQARDDGDGIAPERRDLLFLPGKNLRQDGSVSLGLHLCKRILEDHGGHIGLGSSETGTCFVLTLPLATPEET